VLSWVEYLVSGGLYFYLSLAVLEERWQQITFLAIFSLFLLVITYYDLHSTLTDPTDPNVYYEKDLKRRG